MSHPISRLSALVGITLVLSAAFVLPLPRLAASRDRDRAVRVTRGGPQRPGGGGCPSHASDDSDLLGSSDDGCIVAMHVGAAISSSPVPAGTLASGQTLTHPSFTRAHEVPDVFVHAARVAAPSQGRAPPAA